VDNFRFNFMDIEMPVLDGWGYEWMETSKRTTISKNTNLYIKFFHRDWRQTKAKNNPDILGYMSKPISMEDLLLISNKD
jgi:CheY-like chemotaxis protein